MNFPVVHLPFVFLFTSVIAVASEPTEFRQAADAYLSELTKESQFSGSVIVANDGKVVLSKGYGLANREHGIANAPGTLFRLGSVTKQFTAMCILILQQDDQLDVSDPISRYVDDCPEAWQEITIHHLLTHTSGIPSFTSFPDNLRFERLPTTVVQTVDRFRDKPLELEPGSAMRYSNSGYVLLGHIIEEVSGMTYEAFVNERIFRPLGMESSGYDHPADVLPDRASGYSKRGEEIVNCIPFAMDTPHAAGALYSTVEDLLIWDRALNTDRLVSTDALAQMFEPFKNDYCYGWARGVSGDRVYYGHGGGISGFVTGVVRFPKEKLYVAVLSNHDWISSPEVAKHLGELWFNTQD